MQKGALELKVRGSVQAIMSFAPLRSLYFKIPVCCVPKGRVLRQINQEGQSKMIGLRENKDLDLTKELP